ncbi:putative nuclease HARBI1 [Anomaloglossus baeobatrachus]
MCQEIEFAICGAAIAVAASTAVIEINRNNRRNARFGRIWAREWLLERDRLSHLNLLRELQERHPNDFQNYLRMSENSFKILLQRVEHQITRQNTVMRAAVTSVERLSVTLRFLATGRTLTDLQYSSAISLSALSSIIPDTCQAIIDNLGDFMAFPKHESEWLQLASQFQLQWQFPNCGGAIDGKHIRITQPHHSGSFYHNYKGFFSIILMAVANADYDFVMVDVGLNGRISDGGALEHTEFGRRLLRSQLRLPNNSQTINNLNFVFLGDEAFPLKKKLLRPYPQNTLNAQRTVFNYRLSRARRVVESAFGFLASRFRIFHTAINLKIETIDKVVLACCVLHNFLRKREGRHYIPVGYVDTVNDVTGELIPGSWRENDPHLPPLNPPVVIGRISDEYILNRDKYCDLFNGTGAFGLHV